MLLRVLARSYTRAGPVQRRLCRRAHASRGRAGAVACVCRVSWAHGRVFQCVLRWRSRGRSGPRPGNGRATRAVPCASGRGLRDRIPRRYARTAVRRSGARRWVSTGVYTHIYSAARYSARPSIRIIFMCGGGVLIGRHCSANMIAMVHDTEEACRGGTMHAWDMEARSAGENAMHLDRTQVSDLG